MPFDDHKRMHHVFHRAVSRIHIRINRPRLNDIHRYTPGTEVTCKSSHHTLHCRFAKGICRSTGIRHHIAVYRTYDDNSSAVIHNAGRLHRGMVGAADIDINQAVYVLWIDG